MLLYIDKALNSVKFILEVCEHAPHLSSIANVWGTVKPPGGLREGRAARSSVKLLSDTVPGTQSWRWSIFICWKRLII